MGLLDSIFAQSNYGGQGGGLLDLLRQSQMQQDQYQPSAGFLGQAAPIGIGGYQMPRIGDQAQFTPPPQDPAALPPNAQPTQGQLPMMQQAPEQPQSLPPALGGIGSALGRIGSPDGLIARLTGNDSKSIAQQNLKAQYEALVPVLGQQKAMLAVMNPEAGKILLAQALEKKQYGFTKMEDGTLVRTDPLSGKAELAYGNSDANKVGVAGPDGKIIPYPEGLDSSGRKIFANEVARTNADAATGKMTESQGKAAGFATRMAKSLDIINRTENEGQNVFGKMADKIPGVGSYLQSDNYQSYTAAKQSFINAHLRKDSGASIHDPEFIRAEKELFPQPGEGPTAIREKRERRAAVAAVTMKEAGPGFKMPDTSAASAPSTSQYQEGATATNPQTGQKLTFRGGKWQ